MDARHELTPDLTEPRRDTRNPFAPTDSEIDPVSEEQLRRDVAALLFRNIRDPSTWDRLGDPSTCERASSRQRHVCVDPTPHFTNDDIHFIDLPVGLGLLFDVATSEEFENPNSRRAADALPPMSYVDRIMSRTPSRASSVPSQRGELAPSEPAPHEATASAATDPGAQSEEPPAGGGRTEPETPAPSTPQHDSHPAAEATGPMPPPDPNTVSELIRLRGPPIRLIYMLTLVAEPPSPDDACIRLYTEGMARIAKTRAADAQRAKEAREREEAECTFRPVTSTGRDPESIKFNGSRFYSSTKEWQHKRETKLQKLRDKEQREFDEEVMVPCKMGERSRSIVAARDASISAQAAEQTTPGSAGTAGGPPRTPSASRMFDSEFYGAVDTPLTNHKLEHIFRAAVVRTANAVVGGRSESAATVSRSHSSSAVPAVDRSQSKDTVERSVEDDPQASHPSETPSVQRTTEDEASPDGGMPLDRIVLLDIAFTSYLKTEDGAKVPADVVARMQTDIQERRKHAEHRAQLYQMKQREKLFDKATGQPLFEPNSMPAVIKHGRRIPFETLSDREKRDFVLVCFRQGIDIRTALRIAKRKKEQQRNPRKIDDVVKELIEKHKAAEGRKQRALARKAKEEEREIEAKMFRAPSDSGSLRGGSAAQSSTRVPLSERPLPTRQVPLPTRPSRSDPAAMQHVIQRGAEFFKRREQLIRKAHAEAEKAALSEIRSHPQINPVSELLVQQRRRQLQAELDAFEEHEHAQRKAAEQDRVFDAEKELACDRQRKNQQHRPVRLAVSQTGLDPSGNTRRPRATPLSPLGSAVSSTLLSPLPAEPCSTPAHVLPPPPNDAFSIDSLVDELISAGRNRARSGERAPASPDGPNPAAHGTKLQSRAPLSPPLDYIYRLDDEALRLIASPPHAAAAGGGPLRAFDDRSIADSDALTSKSVDEVLSLWKELDRLSAELLTAGDEQEETT